MTIQLTTYVAPVKENPYKEHIAALLEATEKDPTAALPITVDVNEAAKAQLQVQKAANDVDRTAKLRNTDRSKVKEGKPDEDGDPTFTGEVTLIFQLGKRQKARRNKEAEAAKAEAAEVPAE